MPTSGLRKTDARYKDHVYLTYNLFGEGRHFIRSGSYISEDIQQLIGETVEIRQPSPDFIQFIVWRGTGSDRFMLRQKLLSHINGDFTCGSDGLALKTRTEVWLIIASNHIGSLARTLSRAADGSLIMKITETNMANTAFVIPLGAFDEKWLRWTPVSEASAETPND